MALENPDRTLERPSYRQNSRSSGPRQHPRGGGLESLLHADAAEAPPKEAAPKPAPKPSPKPSIPKPAMPPASRAESLDDLTIFERGMVKIWSYAKDGAKYGGIAGGTYIAAGFSAVVSGLGFVVGKVLAGWKTKTAPKFRELLDSYTSGSVMGALLHYVIPAFITKIPAYEAGSISWGNVGERVLRGTALIPAFNAVYNPLSYAVSQPGDRLFSEPDAVAKESVEHGVKHFVPSTVAAFKYLGLPLAFLNSGLTPDAAIIPGNAAVSAGFSYVLADGGKEKKEAAPQPSPGGMPAFAPG
ncbi:MAG: hypothetical protein V1735_02290 [Nanoarchaeota archaeon]